MKRHKIRWIIEDESEVSVHTTKKSALKEFNRLLYINYEYKNTMELFRHDMGTDEYRKI